MTQGENAMKDAITVQGRCDVNDFLAPSTPELSQVQGGYFPYDIDISQMPSREVGGCGTMWILDQIAKHVSGRR
jgi:hypothetical protein